MIIGGVNFIPPPFNGNFNPQSIAIEGNSIFSGSGDGMDITNVNVLDVESNQIQTGGSGTPINVLNCIGYFVANNVTSGGSVGIRLIGTLPTSTGSIVQNTFRNCGAAAIAVTLTVPIQGTIQLVGNQFGECGLSQLTSVIGIGGASGPDSLQLINNVYFGHVNALNSFIVSSFHMNVVNGNYQTQTTLPNFLP